MAECVTPVEETVPSDSEDEREIYDVPPKRFPRPLPHTEADYMNFKELEVIPAPMLPPKKRTSIDLEAMFGPSTPLPDASGGEFPLCSPAVTANGPGLSGMGSVRKIPVPAPRLSSKQPVAPPRRSKMNGSPSFSPLPDTTSPDSSDGNSFASYPSKVDWCNNNLGELNNQNGGSSHPQTQEDTRSNACCEAVYELEAEHVDMNCEKNPDDGLANAKVTQHDYINASGVLGELNKLPNGNVTKPQEYVNVGQRFGPFVPLAVEELKPPEPAARQVTAAAALYPSLDIGSTSMVAAAPPAIQCEATVNTSDQQRPKVAPESKQDKVKRDYMNIDQPKTNEYTNVSHCVPIDSPGVNMKALLAQCFESPKPPSHPTTPSVNKPQLDTAAYSYFTPSTSSGDVHRHNGNQIPLDDSLYETVPSEATNPANDFTVDPFADLLKNRSSFNGRMSMFDASPPAFNPPPLPSGLLIDFSDGNLYKTPSPPAPVIPDRPPPPPVPARRGLEETLPESAEPELYNIPVAQKEVNNNNNFNYSNNYYRCNFPEGG